MRGSHYPAENRRIMRARLRIVLEAGVREPIVCANQSGALFMPN